MMTVTAEVKEGVIYFSEEGEVTLMYDVKLALMDLRWAAKNQPSEMTEKDYIGCLRSLKPEPTIRPGALRQTRGNNLPEGLYRIVGHSNCPWCKHHHKVKDDPAGGCFKSERVEDYFHNSINGPITAEDFLIGRLPVKEFIEGKVVKNCPCYDFNLEATP